MANFLKALVNASEKAANIARACRYEEDLFKLLVQEKKNEEKNSRFVQDFKTLADVLIQETVKHDIGKQFPEIAPYIKGEESNTFCNTLGESITVEVQDDVDITMTLLNKVLDGDVSAAKLLAIEVHKEVNVLEDFSRKDLPESLPLQEFGVWIDPIDSTAEYIHGGECRSPRTEIYQGGLHCVTVLIGVYDRKTGAPVIGVVNQPFYREDENTKIWHGRYFWGLSYQGHNISSLSGKEVFRNDMQKVIVISGSESEDLKSALRKKYIVVDASGAGYKQMCVAIGLADGYLLSKGTTFRWDTCGPHGLLHSIGGGVANYSKCMLLEEFDSLDLPVSRDFEISYHSGDDDTLKGSKKWCNTGGIIAYRNPLFLNDLLKTIQPYIVT